jgi:hypothetical protein
MILDPEMLIYHSFKKVDRNYYAKYITIFWISDVKSPKTIVVFSTQSMEGKTVIGNMPKH